MWRRSLPWLFWLAWFGVWEYIGLRNSEDNNIPFSQLIWHLLNWPGMYVAYALFFLWFVPHVFTKGDEWNFYRRLFRRRRS